MWFDTRNVQVFWIIICVMYNYCRANTSKYNYGCPTNNISLSCQNALIEVTNASYGMYNNTICQSCCDPSESSECTVDVEEVSPNIFPGIQAECNNMYDCVWLFSNEVSISQCTSPSISQYLQIFYTCSSAGTTMQPTSARVDTSSQQADTSSQQTECFTSSSPSAAPNEGSSPNVSPAVIIVGAIGAVIVFAALVFLCIYLFVNRKHINFGYFRHRTPHTQGSRPHHVALSFANLAYDPPKSEESVRKQSVKPAKVIELDQPRQLSFTTGRTSEAISYSGVDPSSTSDDGEVFSFPATGSMYENSRPKSKQMNQLSRLSFGVKQDLNDITKGHSNRLSSSSTVSLGTFKPEPPAERSNCATGPLPTSSAENIYEVIATVNQDINSKNSSGQTSQNTPTTITGTTSNADGKES